MPVRSLTSSILKWPDAKVVDRALREWADRAARNRQDVLRIGYFGSYARGDWGVGSDLDLLIVVEDSDRPFERRSVEWDTTALPVPTDVLVYTGDEWHSMAEQRSPPGWRREIVWIYQRSRV